MARTLSLQQIEAIRTEIASRIVMGADGANHFVGNQASSDVALDFGVSYAQLRRILDAYFAPFARREKRPSAPAELPFHDPRVGDLRHRIANLETVVEQMRLLINAISAGRGAHA